ncbi:MAG: TonB-dependent receptor [Paludibacter sp.]|nr:TonB-dependent receptor [Paludibacter sp.]
MSKQLDELVVLASKINSPLKKSSEIIQIISAKEITQLNANSVSEIFQYLSGVGVSTGTGSGLPKRGVISINGLSPNYTLVLIDGARFVSDHLQTGQNIELIPVENIDRIEIIKGAYSAQYGSDALGGIVNIITKKCADKQAMNFNLSAGSYNTYNTSLMSHNPINKKQRLSNFISWEQSDGLPLIAPVHRIGSMNYENMITQNRFDAEIGNNITAYISANYLKSKMVFKAVEKNSSLFMPDAGINWKVSSKFSLRPVIHYVYWKSDQNAEDIKLFNPEISAQFNFSDHNTVLAGVDYKENSYTRTSVQKHTISTMGAFIQDRLELNKFIIAAAIRFDKVQEIKPVFSPSISIMYKATDYIHLKASAGKGFHSPSVQELYELAYGHGGTALRFGNPDLKPEYSTTYSASAEYIKDNLQLVVNGFYTEIENMIVPSYGGPWPADPTKDMWIRQNVHAAKVFGSEFLATYTVFRGYTINAGYTFTKNKNAETGRQLPYSPGNVLNFKFNGKQKISENINIGFFAGLNSALGRKAWNWQPAPGTIRTDESGLITPLKDYQNLEAGLMLNFNKYYRISFNAYNILGQDIENLEDAYTKIKGEAYFKIGLNYRFH